MLANISKVFLFGTLLLGTQAAVAEPDYPTRPVTIVVPFTGGSQVDIVAREVARGLEDKWNQPVIVDNKPGAGGTLGTRYVANAQPDGYTLMLTSASHSINPSLYKALPYDTLKELTGVTFATSVPNVLVVSPDLGVKSIEELLKLIRDNPGKYNFASAGIGSGTHFNGEMFKAIAKLDIVHVPYKGTGEALVDTVAQRSMYYWSPLGLTLPFIRDGRLIPLAVSTAQRAPLMPDVPAISEVVPDVVYDHWYGMMAPSATPADVLEKVARDVGDVLTSEKHVQALASQGVTPRPTSPAEFNTFIESEITRLGEIVKVGNIPRL